MKIKLTYIPEEEQEAAAVLAALRLKYPRARVHKNDRYPPFKHAYLTIKKPENPSGMGVST